MIYMEREVETHTNNEEEGVGVRECGAGEIEEVSEREIVILESARQRLKDETKKNRWLSTQTF